MAFRIHTLPAELQPHVRERLLLFQSKCDRKMNELMAALTDCLADLACHLYEDMQRDLSKLRDVEVASQTKPKRIVSENMEYSATIEVKSDNDSDVNGDYTTTMMDFVFLDNQDVKAENPESPSKQPAEINQKPPAESTSKQPATTDQKPAFRSLYTSDEDEEDDDYFGDREPPKQPFVKSHMDDTIAQKRKAESERKFQLEFERHLNGLNEPKPEEGNADPPQNTPTTATSDDAPKPPTTNRKPKRPKTRDHQCDLCANTYFEKASLEKHINSRHTGQRPFRCDICKMGSNSKIGIAAHMRRHTGERPLMCQLCPNTYASHSAFGRHMRSHAGERRHKCTLCPKAYVEKVDLRMHMAGHTGDLPYRCPVCDRGFYKRFLVLRHLEKTHDVERRDAEVMYPRKIPFNNVPVVVPED